VEKNPEERTKDNCRWKEGVLQPDKTNLVDKIHKGPRLTEDVLTHTRTGWQGEHLICVVPHRRAL